MSDIYIYIQVGFGSYVLTPSRAKKTMDGQKYPPFLKAFAADAGGERSSPYQGL